MFIELYVLNAFTHHIHDYTCVFVYENAATGLKSTQMCFPIIIMSQKKQPDIR